MCNKDLALPGALKTVPFKGCSICFVLWPLWGERRGCLHLRCVLVVSSRIFPQDEEIGTANSGGVFASVVPLPACFKCASFPCPPLKSHYFIKSKKKHNLEQQQAEPKLIV